MTPWGYFPLARGKYPLSSFPPPSNSNPEDTMTDDEPNNETCDGCEQQFDPELLTTCRYTESDGNIECLRFCPSCISH